MGSNNRLLSHPKASTSCPVWPVQTSLLLGGSQVNSTVLVCQPEATLFVIHTCFPCHRTHVTRPVILSVWHHRVSHRVRPGDFSSLSTLMMQLRLEHWCIICLRFIRSHRWRSNYCTSICQRSSPDRTTTVHHPSRFFQKRNSLPQIKCMSLTYLQMCWSCCEPVFQIINVNSGFLAKTTRM